MKNRDRLIAFFVGLIVFIVYLTTMSPTISGHDSSELASVQATLGIAHPTGYPLFTIIGYLFSNLPLPFEPVMKLNILNSFFGALGITFLFLSLLLTQRFLFKDKMGNSFFYNYYFQINAAFGSLLLGFSSIYWKENLAVEVYTLHFFLLSLLIYIFLKIYFLNNNVSPSINAVLKEWYPLFVVLGLSLTNHLSTVYIIPAILFLFLSKLKLSRKSFLSLFFLLLVMSIPLILIYLYLPIRASMNPDLNWGTPSDHNNFIYHVTGGLYREHFLSGFEEFKNHFKHFLQTLFHPDYWQFNIGILFGIWGFDVILRKNRKLFWFLIIVFFTNLIIALNYRIPDIDAYFMLSYIVLIFCLSAAFTELYFFLKLKWLRFITLTFLIIIILGIQFFGNYSKMDYSDNYMFYDYTREVLSSVDSNAVILCDPLTPFVFPSIYLQFVENFRKDVAVISTTLTQRWYLEQVNKYHRDLVDLNQNKFIFNFSKRPVYIYSGLVNDFSPPKGFYAAPDKYLYKYVDSVNYFPIKPPNVNVRITENENNPYLLYIKYNIAIMLENRLKYEEKFNQLHKAEKYVEILRRKFPDFPYESVRYYP